MQASSPQTQRDSSISRVNRCSRGEMALISLGIHVSSSKRTRVSPGRLWTETGLSVRGLYLSHDKRLMPMENASRVPKRKVFLKHPNLLICCEMRCGETTRLIKLPEWHCQRHGTAPFFWHSEQDPILRSVT